MIMNKVITVVAMCFAVLNLVTATTDTKTNKHQSIEVEETKIDQKNIFTDDTGINVNVTAIAARFIQDYMTPTICSYSPNICAKYQIQSRGIQSYLATAGTMFAGILGVILTKISVLIGLSLLTTLIGKMMFVYLHLNSKDHHYHSHGYHGSHGHYAHYHHKSHAPFVKYTKDKYYIKNTPSVHSHDTIVEPHSPYQAHHPSGGVNYYKR